MRVVAEAGGPSLAGAPRRLAATGFATAMLLSLVLTFHVLYDSAVLYTLEDNVAGDPNLMAVDDTDALLTDDVNNLITSDIIPIQMKIRLPQTNPEEKENNIPTVTSSSSSISSRVHFPRTSRRLPQAIIVGVRKCGTRALLEMLALHPRVQKAAGEVHFFDRDENYRKGLDWYRRKMPHSFRGQITIEKSPSYFVTPEVPERIRAMNASIKLLLIVREPVTRAISDYTQLRSHAASAATASTLTQAPGAGIMTPSAAAAAAAAAARSFEQLAIRPDGSVNLQYRPLAVSLYHTFMHRWLESFHRDQILIVNGDQLIEDPVPQLQRIENFLGLEPRIGRHNFYFNETKGFYCLRNDTADKCLRESKGRRHPRVDPQVIGQLRRFYAEHNQRFYELVGEDLGWPEE